MYRCPTVVCKGVSEKIRGMDMFLFSVSFCVAKEKAPPPPQRNGGDSVGESLPLLP